MNPITRRDFGALALAGLAAPKPNSVVNGIQIGVQSYSFRDRSLDAAIGAMAEIGINACELWQGHVEPNQPSAYGVAEDARRREEIRKWRSSVPMRHFTAIRDQFRAAEIKLLAYDYSFRDDFSEAEVVRGFEMAKALGVNVMVASSTLTMARKLEPLAAKFGIRIGMHGHSKADEPNEFSTPESYEKAFSQGYKHICAALDLGHFVSAGGNPIEFLDKYQDRVVTVHLKDRKKNQGPNMPWGQGDTPIMPVLARLKKTRSGIPANIEYTYTGADTMAEVRRCLEYCRRALA